MTKVRGGKKRVSTGLDKMRLARDQVHLKNDQLESEQEPAITIATGSKDCVPDDLAISMVSPDPDNAREFPVIKAAAEAMFLTTAGEGAAYVILEKGSLINKTPEDHPLFLHIEKQITGIKSLANQVESDGGIYQSIEVFRRGGTNYQIVFGHRRFYSVVYLLGWDGVWSFKVHRTTPNTVKLRQFVENTSRSDLALHEKLKSFHNAVKEISSNDGNLPKSEIIKKLGIGRSTFYTLSKWDSYPFVADVLVEGIDFITHQVVTGIFKDSENQSTDSTSVEDLLKIGFAKAFKQAKKQVPVYLKVKSKSTVQKQNKKTNRSGRKASCYKTPKMQSTMTIKKLLTEDVTQLKIEGVNWQQMDWTDRAQVNDSLSATIAYLENLKE